MLNGSQIKHSDAASPLTALKYMRKETVHLRRFDDLIKMELLYIILYHEEDLDWNISRYVDALSTSPQSDSRMILFIRGLVRGGALVASNDHKRTAIHLFLSDTLRQELRTYIRLYNGEEVRHLTESEEAALLFAFKMEKTLKSSDKGRS